MSNGSIFSLSPRNKNTQTLYSTERETLFTQQCKYNWLLISIPFAYEYKSKLFITFASNLDIGSVIPHF